MTRKLLTATTAVIALAAAPMAFADQDAGDLAGDSPAVTNSGLANEVASGGSSDYDTNSPRITNGDAPVDNQGVAITGMEQDFLEKAQGANLETADGEVIGTIEEVTYSAQGNPELHVDLIEDSKIGAESLVITALPEAVSLVNGQVKLDTNTDELYLAAESGTVRDGNGTARVSLM